MTPLSSPRSYATRSPRHPPRKRPSQPRATAPHVSSLVKTTDFSSLSALAPSTLPSRRSSTLHSSKPRWLKSQICWSSCARICESWEFYYREMFFDPLRRLFAEFSEVTIILSHSQSHLNAPSPYKNRNHAPQSAGKASSTTRTSMVRSKLTRACALHVSSCAT